MYIVLPTYLSPSSDLYRLISVIPSSFQRFREAERPGKNAYPTLPKPIPSLQHFLCFAGCSCVSLHSEEMEMHTVLVPVSLEAGSE